MDSIHPSWHIARLSLLGRRSRTVLVGIAVALASTLVVAVSCAMATAMTNVQARVHALVGRTDARIVHRNGADFDANAIEIARGLPQVKAAAGRLGGSLALEAIGGQPNSDGRQRRATLQCKGTDLTNDREFGQFEYIAGTPPMGESEIGLDPAAAKALGVQPGDRLRVIQFGDPIELRVSGIYKRPLLGALQRPSGHLSRTMLAQATQRDDVVSVISLVLHDSVAPKEWVTANAPSVKAPLLLEGSEMIASGLDRPFDASRVGLALASMLVFLCCSIIVGTAMTTALSEQQRAFAMARCIGASRTQLFFGQLLAGCALSLTAGMIGVPLGIAITGAVVTYNSSLLPAGLEVSWLGVTLALVGSIGAGVIGALWPAWQASRVSPLDALAPHAHPARRRAIWLAVAIGVSCILAQLSLLAIGDGQARFWSYILVGLPLIHLGWFILSVPVLVVLSITVAPLLERMGKIPTGLLSGSLRSAPWRFGMVGATMMIGVAILVASRTTGVAIMENISQRIRFGDAFAFKATGFSSAETQRIRDIASVSSACAVGYMPLKVFSQAKLGLDGISTPSVVCIGFDSVEFLAMNRLEWIAGDPNSASQRLLEGDAILVAPEFLKARGIVPGSFVDLGSDSNHRRFEVVGVVGCAGLDVATQFFGIRSLYMEHAVSCVFMDFNAVARHFGTKEAYLVQMEIPASAGESETALVGEAVESAAPGAIFASGRAIRNEVLEIGATILTLAGLVAAGALVLASLAAGSIIAASVATRAHQFGVLQAVGASKSLVGRLIVAEALAIGLTGSLVGYAFGAHLAFMESIIYHDIAGLDLQLSFSWLVVLAGAGGACFTAVLAALPAIRSLVRRPVRELIGIRT